MVFKSITTLHVHLDLLRKALSKYMRISFNKFNMEKNDSTSYDNLLESNQ